MEYEYEGGLSKKAGDSLVAGYMACGWCIFCSSLSFFLVPPGVVGGLQVIDSGDFLSASVRAFLVLGPSVLSSSSSSPLSSMPSRSSSSLSRFKVPLLSKPDNEKCDSER